MKPFAITDFMKAMLYIKGRKPTIAQQRQLLIEHIILYTRKDWTLTETNIYDEIKKVWDMPEDKLERKFERAMKKKFVMSLSLTRNE
jgi:hypothetical protein